MEAFNILKYWRTTGGFGCVATSGDSTDEARATNNTVVAAVSPNLSDGEDGPYIDLKLTQDDDGETKAQQEANEDETVIECTAEEMSENEHEEEELGLSPSDALFLERNLVSVKHSGILSNSSEESPKSPVSLLKPATKFRIFFLKLKKSKSGNGLSEKSEEIETIEVDNGKEEASPSSKIQEKQGRASGKVFTVRFKVEEIKLPLISLFKRDNSSNQNNGDGLKNEAAEDSDSISAKETLQRYLKMIKPLRVRVSKRYLEKLKFSGQFSLPGGSPQGSGTVPPPCTAAEKGGEVVELAVARSLKADQKQGSNNLLVGLKVVGKHLGKSRSASATVAASQPGKMAPNRCDDSLMQLQDGIQGAILHCKKSLDASGGGESSSTLSRSVSDPARNL